MKGGVHVKRINIKGVIISNDDKWIYDWFEIESTTPKEVENEMAAANGEDLEVIINSGGGDLFAGVEIYTMLKDYSGKVINKIVGFAGSAASVVALSGKTLMSPAAQMMIHNAAFQARGNYRDMEHAAGVLRSVDQSIINAYQLKSGMNRDELLKMMNETTWLTPQQALEKGLIDEIMFDDQSKLAASVDISQMLPQEVINKLRNEFKNNSLKDYMVKNKNGLSDKKEEEKLLTLEQIKNEHPELFKQIKDEGYNDGIKAERERIKAIEELSISGHEEILNKAKFETGISVENVAMEIIKAEKQRGSKFLNDRKEDAQPLNDVDGSAAPIEDKNKNVEREAVVNNMVKGANQMRGVNN